MIESLAQVLMTAKNLYGIILLNLINSKYQATQLFLKQKNIVLYFPKSNQFHFAFVNHQLPRPTAMYFSKLFKETQCQSTPTIRMIEVCLSH